MWRLSPSSSGWVTYNWSLVLNVCHLPDWTLIAENYFSQVQNSIAVTIAALRFGDTVPELWQWKSYTRTDAIRFVGNRLGCNWYGERSKRQCFNRSTNIKTARKSRRVSIDLKCGFVSRAITEPLLFALHFDFRSIYHFDPSNLPPCSKLQMSNASPVKTPSPTSSANETSNAPPTRKKTHKPANVSNVTDDSAVVQRTSEKCDRENVSNSGAKRDESGACKPEIEVSSELEVTLPEPSKNISMNSLLSPLNQTYQETQDNNLDRKAAEGMLQCSLCSLTPTKHRSMLIIIVNLVDNCPEAAVHLNVKSQSTSPNIPCDSETFQLTPSDQSTPSNVDVRIFWTIILELKFGHKFTIQLLSAGEFKSAQ